MAYFQTDDIPVYPTAKPKPLLTLISPKGIFLLENVQSHHIRNYYKKNHTSGNGKKIWRQELTKLGYVIEDFN